MALETEQTKKHLLFSSVVTVDNGLSYTCWFSFWSTFGVSQVSHLRLDESQNLILTLIFTLVFYFLQMSVYASGVSVLMPGDQIPTFIAHPAPCCPERIPWPSHQHNTSLPCSTSNTRPNINEVWEVWIWQSSAYCIAGFGAFSVTLGFAFHPFFTRRSSLYRFLTCNIGFSLGFAIGYPLKYKKINFCLNVLS